MPRSAPGAATGAPSSSTRPVVGVSSPATMRSSVDLPQPDGPEDRDEVVVGDRRASSAAAPRSARRRARRETSGRRPRCASLLMRASTLTQGSTGYSRWFAHLNRKSEIEPDHADHDDAEDDLAGVEQRLAVGDHVADAATTRRSARRRSRRSTPSPARAAASRRSAAPRSAAARGARRRATIAPSV